MNAERRELTAQFEPPEVVTLDFCPSCGRRVVGSYNIDTAREKCSKTWHKALTVPVRYVREGAL